jgi:4-amino-4-deoxy-L-arabinose transferase-like glycosyltransferase
MVSTDPARVETSQPRTTTFAPTEQTSARPARALAAITWPRVGLTAVLAVSAALNFINLASEGYGNTYYAAAVKSMLTSWHNFFFASFDANGFVSVDKPALGLWIQAISAKLFGFSGVSLLAPQALAGVASVGILYLLIRQVWGPAAGLIAALALAVTPISVVTDRNNTIDSLLILFLLGAAWAVTAATRRGSLPLLLLTGALVGLGFNIKMLQAYLVLPGIALIYLLGARRGPWAKICHLALLGVVTLAVSLAWVVAVDLTPANARPYIGSSGTNSALSLVLGYNGLGRLTTALPQGIRDALSFLPGNIDLEVVPGNSPGIGDPGLLRLFNSGIGGQASWLLALAVIGLVAGIVYAIRRLPLDERGQSVVLWGGWLVGTAGFFSVARFFHPYYLTMLGPGIAALVGIGVAVLWRGWLRGGIWSIFLPAALIGTAIVQGKLLVSNAEWSARLTLPIGAICVLGAGALLAARFFPHLGRRSAPLFAAVTLSALLIAPTVWSVVSVQAGNGGAWLPEAGPTSVMGFGSARSGTGGGQPGNFGGGQAGGFGGTTGGAIPQGRGGTPPQGQKGGAFGQQPGRNGTTTGNGGTAGGTATGNRTQGGFGGFGGGGGNQAMTYAGANWNPLNAGLTQYLLANQGSAKYLVATTSSSYASVFELATDQSALALGGYQGWDRILTPAQLAAMVSSGEIRFFYISGSIGTVGQRVGTNATNSASSTDGTSDLTAWVQSTCTVVPSATYTTTGAAATGNAFGGGGQLQLYDCAKK